MAPRIANAKNQYRLSFVCFLVFILFNKAESFQPFPAKSFHQQHLSRFGRRVSDGKLIKNDFERIIAQNPTVVQMSQSAAINMAAIKSVSKLLSTCGLGILAAKKNILDQSSLSVLSKLIFNVFQPCLLFVNVASTVASLNKGIGGGSKAAVFLLPFAACMQVLIGYLVGKIVSFFMYKKEDQLSESARQLLACTAFGNSGPLPLVFTDGLFRTHNDVTLLSRSVAYISLYLLGWSPLFWIVCPPILEESTGQKKSMKETLTRIFSPPVVASLLGMVVGFVPFLQKIISSPQGILNPVFEAMRTLSTAYLPAVLLVLAGSLFPPPATTSSNQDAVVKEEKANNLPLEILSIFLARFVLMPVIGFSLYSLSKKFPAANALFKSDPLLLLVLLLETCMPSAQNTTVILQLQNFKSAAARLAQKLLILYVLGVPAISYWLINILKIVPSLAM